MVVTLEDLIKKYPTKINLNKMSKGLKELLVTEGNIDNVRKPKYIETDEGYSYEYRVGEKTFTVYCHKMECEWYDLIMSLPKEGNFQYKAFFRANGEPVLCSYMS